MTEAQFTTNQESVKVALARSFQLHPSLIRISIDSNRRLAPITTSRMLSTTNVKLVVELFVTPSDASAMQSKVAQVKLNPAALASAVMMETGITVIPALVAPAVTANVSPPDDFQNETEEVDANTAAVLAPKSKSSFFIVATTVLFLLLF
jgi:hypothetical protein